MTKQLAPIFGATLLAAIGIASAAMAIRAHGQQQSPASHYTVEQDVYVHDPQALCQQAWAVALERFGPGVAESVTMTGGVMEPTKCLAVLFQVVTPKQVVSAGIDVREVRR